MIKQNLQTVLSRLDNIRSSRRNQDNITLVAVTKTVSMEKILTGIACGITEIGENRVQEAETKFVQLPADKPIKKHLIGHLQTNKVKKAVMLFDMIQSVDSLRLAGEINSQAGKINKIQDCLIEIKVSTEETKYGLPPSELKEFIRATQSFPNLRVCGLMTIAPFLSDPKQTRPYFRKAKNIFDDIKSDQLFNLPGFEILSMGMSNDFEIAAEEGANMVRVGTAIFGDRNY